MSKDIYNARVSQRGRFNSDTDLRDDDTDDLDNDSYNDSDDPIITLSQERANSLSAQKLIKKKQDILNEIIEITDPAGVELVGLLDPQDDDDDEDIEISSRPRTVSFFDKVFTEDLSEHKYDADIDTQSSTEFRIATMRARKNDLEGSIRSSLSISEKKLTELVPNMAAALASDRTEKRTSQWEELMRKFSEAHKEECKTVSLDIPRTLRSTKHFPTGSQYEGMWDILGMSGYGTYTFPNGVVYEGEFEDGMFHGNGQLRYPNGDVLRGVWEKGHMTERTLMFADGLEYTEEDWKYCKMPDRRFTVEYKNGLQPSGKTYLTANQPTRKIPPGHYDTGDGFYDPITKIIYDADNITTIIRSPSVREQKWIIENCRSSVERPLGPRPDLYEKWSEPQVQPKAVPSPSAAIHSNLRLASLTGEHDLEYDDIFYDLLRNSRASYMASRINWSGQKYQKSSQRFRWEE